MDSAFASSSDALVSTAAASASAWAALRLAESSLAARLVAPSASLTVAFLATGSRTSSMTAMGALSPLRAPIFVMRV